MDNQDVKKQSQDHQDVTAKKLSQRSASSSSDPANANPEDLNCEEYPSQLSTILNGPLLRIEAEIEGEEQDPDALSISQASCSTLVSDNCWKFDCERQSLDTYGCNNGREVRPEVFYDSSVPPEDYVPDYNETVYRRGGLPISSSETQTRDDLDHFNSPRRPSELSPSLSPSMEFLRDTPSYVTPGPNPLRIPHDEVLNAVNGFTNMFLAHEISVDENFRLESFIPKEESLEARVRKEMKRAFWDKFEQTFYDTPPNYKHALVILREIKKEILGLLLPHNRTTRHRIMETLDVDHIEKSIKNCAFDPADFQKYADFIIGILSQLCCPARDPEVNDLRQIRNPARVFRGIFETIDKMKMDMANFLVIQSRPLISKQCVHYERVKFADFLELEYRLHDDGLKATRLWLFRHKVPDRDTQDVISKAFEELLNYDMKNQWPETLTLDAGRFLDISHQVKRLAIIGACILAVGSVYQVMFRGKFEHDLREKTKKHLKLIFTVDDIKDEEKTKEGMLRIAEQMCALVNEFVQNQLERQISKVERDEIRNAIAAVATPEHKIHTLMLRRLNEYVEQVTRASRVFPIMPPGLAIIHHEVHSTMSQFFRLLNHQRRAFEGVFFGIINGELEPPVYPDQRNGEWDPNFCDLVKMLREGMTEEEWEEQARTDDVRRVQQAQAQLPDGIA